MNKLFTRTKPEFLHNLPYKHSIGRKNNDICLYLTFEYNGEIRLIFKDVDINNVYDGDGFMYYEAHLDNLDTINQYIYDEFSSKIEDSKKTIKRLKI